MSVTAATHYQTHSYEWVFDFTFLRGTQTIKLNYKLDVSASGHFGIFKRPINLEFDFNGLVDRVGYKAGLTFTDEERINLLTYFMCNLPTTLVMVD